MKLSDMLAPDRIAFLDPEPKFDLLDRMVKLIATSPNIKDADAFREAVFNREKDLSTGIGQGLAIPHAKIAEVADFTMALGICSKGVDFDSFDSHPIHFVILIGANDRQARHYIKVLANVVKVFKEDENRRALMEAGAPEEVYRLLQCL